VKLKKENLNTACIILIIVLAALAIVGSVLVRRFEYVAGTRNDGYYGFTHSFGLSFILFLLLTPIMISASILALINLVLLHRNTGQILFKLVLLILGPVITLCAFEYISPLSPVFLEGLEQWVTKEADIDAIQTWLAREGSKHTGQHYSAENGFPEGLPDCLVNLNPKFISFKNSTSKNGPTVEINWHYFMDDYGLIIGPPEMETPEKGCLKHRRDYYEFRRPIKKGAYIFIRG